MRAPAVRSLPKRPGGPATERDAWGERPSAAGRRSRLAGLPVVCEPCGIVGGRPGAVLTRVRTVRRGTHYSGEESGRWQQTNVPRGAVAGDLVAAGEAAA